MRIYWLLASAVLSAIVFGLQYYALETYLYWRYVWFDVPMHFLGGVAIASLLVGFWWRFRPVVYALSFGLIIVSWEVFEFLAGMPREANYAFDTALDLLIGSSAAIITYGIARFTLWRSV
jgi:cytochrome c oxidase subunit IV